MSGELQHAITAIRSGDKITGKRLLAQVLQAEPSNQAAWLWMSAVVDTDRERARCLERVLAINPNNETAQRGLKALRQKQTAPLQAQVRLESPLPTGAPQTMQGIDQPGTKKCPYCAETIKAEAAVCRFCGRDLRTEQAIVQPSPTPEPIPTLPQPSERIPSIEIQRRLLDEEVERRTKKGWQVVSRNDAAVQVRKPKQWSRVGVVLFVLLPALGGCFFPALFVIALIGLLFVIIDYLLKKEKLEYIRLEQPRRKVAGRQSKSVTLASSKGLTEKLPKSTASQTSKWVVPALAALGGITAVVLVIAFVLGAASLRARTPSQDEAPNPMVLPTPTPMPTATSTPNPAQSTQAEQEYLAQIMQISFSYMQALELMSERIIAASDDPLLLFDTDWQNDLSGTSTILKTNGELVRELQPPPRFRGIHRDVRTAALHFDNVAGLIADFVQDYDADKLERATAEMELGTSAIERATQKLEELK
jgi:hypothetical protein